MNPSVICQQYLVTYSQADGSTFFTSENFGKMLNAERPSEWWLSLSLHTEAYRLQKMTVSQKYNCRKT